MQEWARFATPCAFFFFFLHLRKECSDKFNTHSCGDLLAGLEDGTRLLYVDAEPNLVAALTLALWFWNQTCTTRTLSPVSAASVSLTWKRRHKRFPASHKKTKHFTARWTTLPPQHILHVGFFDLLWFHWTVEWIQRSFWTSRVIASSKSWSGCGACFLGPGLRRPLRYLSVTFGARCLRYTSPPQLTQNRVLLATSKRSLGVGETLF